MKILASMPVELDERSIKHVVEYYLSTLTRGDFVYEKNGKLVLIEDVATSHRFDIEADYQDPVRIGIVKAVQDFRAAVKDYESAFAKDGRK